MSIRTRLLNRAFNLLYGPLVFLHEPAGACLFGKSWHGRRANVLDRVDGRGLLLDLGCGSGHLLKAANVRGHACIGIDPSMRMLLRARRNGAAVVCARAEELPVADASVSFIVSTYPGPWIRNAAVWIESARVLVPGGTFVVLFGGTVEYGSASFARSIAGRTVYGKGDVRMNSFEPPGGAGHAFRGSMKKATDEWGTVYYWEGGRLQD